MVDGGWVKCKVVRVEYLSGQNPPQPPASASSPPFLSLRSSSPQHTQSHSYLSTRSCCAAGNSLPGFGLLLYTNVRESQARAEAQHTLGRFVTHGLVSIFSKDQLIHFARHDPRPIQPLPCLAQETPMAMTMTRLAVIGIITTATASLDMSKPRKPTCEAPESPTPPMPPTLDRPI